MSEEKNLLVPGMVFGDRYLIGKMMSKNEECAIFRGYDRVLEQFVLVRQKLADVEERVFLEKAKWFSLFDSAENIVDIYRYEKLSGYSLMIHAYHDGAVGICEVPEEAESDCVQIRKEDVMMGTDGVYYVLDFHISVDYCVADQEESGAAEPVIAKGEDRQVLSPGMMVKEQYKIIRTIGMGGFGITYLALDTMLNRLVAVKEYMPSGWVTRDGQSGCVEVLSSSVLEGYKKGLQKFREEAVCMARFQSHPSVASVYDLIYERESAYLVMEYIEGENLGRFGKLIGGFSYEAARDLFLKVLYTIKEIHEEGIIHGDISPGNIILTQKNEVKLIDFGSAHLPGKPARMLSEMMLKPGYAAIEQYDEEYREDERTDIYQAAATFYTLITGKRPEEANSRWKKDELRFPSELGIEMPPEEEQALRKALEVKPEQRMRDVDEWISVFV